MTVTTATEMPLPAQDLTTLEVQALLGASLPGLSDADLRDLAAKVIDELELRIGNALAENMTEAQLDEFGLLMDTSDDDGCAAWLQFHRPDYRATVMTLRACLVAEVVQTVLSADPSGADGKRGFAQVFPLSMDLVAAHLESEGLGYTRTSDVDVEVKFSGSETIPKVVVHIRKPGTDMLCFGGTAPGLEFAADMRSRVHAFAADWNVRTWLPKAVTSVDDATGSVTLTAEVAVPLGEPVTRVAVDAMMHRSLGSILGFYRAAAQQLLGPTEDGARGNP